jgi:RNA polymerase sigma-70 factor (ECF subfamily)
VETALGFKAVPGQDLTVLWTVAQPVVRSYVRSMVRDVHVTEDLLQQVALTLVERFEQYDRGRNFTGWCMGIAKNKLMNYFTTQSRDRHQFGSEAMEKVAEAYTSVQSENLDREIALAACLRLLKGRARMVIAMRFEQGSRTSAIAAALGTTPNAIRIMLHRTRNQLAECISRHLHREELA